MINAFFENIVPWILGIWLVAIVVFAIVYHIKNYINNRKHQEHESRVVQLKNGKFQVQEWIGNLYSPEDDYICSWQEAKSFLKKATFDTLEEAKAAKIEHDNTWKDIVNREIVDKVIEGAEN
jgi:predicted membrane protein